MVPQSQPRKPRNSSRINLIISLVFHGVLVIGLFYFAAREGLVGKQLQKLAVSMVKDKPVEKPKPAEKKEPPKDDIPKLAVKPVMTAPKEPAPQTTAATVAPPVSAPPAVDVPALVFDGGRTVESADPITIYKGEIESSIKANWNRPENMDDNSYVAEVDIQVDPNGRLSDPVWKQGLGNQKWDDSVKSAVAATGSLTTSPPKGFPSHVIVKFNVAEDSEPIMP